MLSSAGKASSIMFSLLLWRRIQAQECYYRDQTIEPNGIVCNTSAPASLCCQIGASCLTSGLCFSQWDVSINTGTCTDQTWRSPACFQQCRESLGNDHGFHTLYRCSDNLWCCSTGGNITSCCNDSDVDRFPLNDSGIVMGGTGFLTGFTIAPVELLQTSMGTASSSALATSNAIDVGPTKSQSSASMGTASSSALATSNAIDVGPTKSRSSAAARNTTGTEAPYPKDNTSVSDVTKTGLGAGLGVGLPLLAGLTVALLYLRRARTQSNSQNKGSEKKSAGVVIDSEFSTHYERQQMESLPAEMPSSRREITQEIGVRE